MYRQRKAALASDVSKYDEVGTPEMAHNVQKPRWMQCRVVMGVLHSWSCCTESLECFADVSVTSTESGVLAQQSPVPQCASHPAVAVTRTPKGVVPG